MFRQYDSAEAAEAGREAAKRKLRAAARRLEALQRRREVGGSNGELRRAEAERLEADLAYLRSILSASDEGFIKRLLTAKVSDQDLETRGPTEVARGQVQQRRAEAERLEADLAYLRSILSASDEGFIKRLLTAKVFSSNREVSSEFQATVLSFSAAFFENRVSCLEEEIRKTKRTKRKTSRKSHPEKEWDSTTTHSLSEEQSKYPGGKERAETGQHLLLPLSEQGVQTDTSVLFLTTPPSVSDSREKFVQTDSTDQPVIMGEILEALKKINEEYSDSSDESVGTNSVVTQGESGRLLPTPKEVEVLGGTTSSVITQEGGGRQPTEQKNDQADRLTDFTGVDMSLVQDEGEDGGSLPPQEETPWRREEVLERKVEGRRRQDLLVHALRLAEVFSVLETEEIATRLGGRLSVQLSRRGDDGALEIDFWEDRVGSGRVLVSGAGQPEIASRILSFLLGDKT